MGNSAEEKCLHSLISTEKMREQTQRLRRLIPRQRGSGRGKLRIKESDQTNQCPHMKIKEVNQK